MTWRGLVYTCCHNYSHQLSQLSAPFRLRSVAFQILSDYSADKQKPPLLIIFVRAAALIRGNSFSLLPVLWCHSYLTKRQRGLHSLSNSSRHVKKLRGILALRQVVSRAFTHRIQHQKQEFRCFPTKLCKASCPWKGFLKQGYPLAAGHSWRALHSSASAPMKPWTPLSSRCWLLSSAAAPSVWPELCYWSSAFLMALQFLDSCA